MGVWLCPNLYKIGLRINAQAHTNQERIDVVVELIHHIYLFEFKLDGRAEEALQQIKEHDDAAKYKFTGKPITLSGANFDNTQRKVSEWQHKRVQG